MCCGSGKRPLKFSVDPDQGAVSRNLFSLSLTLQERAFFDIFTDFLIGNNSWILIKKIGHIYLTDIWKLD